MAMPAACGAFSLRFQGSCPSMRNRSLWHRSIRGLDLVNTIRAFLLVGRRPLGETCAVIRLTLWWGWDCTKITIHSNAIWRIPVCWCRRRLPIERQRRMMCTGIFCSINSRSTKGCWWRMRWLSNSGRNGRKLYFFSRLDRADASKTMEIDFLIVREYDNAAMKPRISPIEVKSTKRYGVSFARQIPQKVCPTIGQGIRSASPPTRSGWRTHQAAVVYGPLSVICAD